MRTLFFALSVVALAGCQPEQATEVPATPSAEPAPPPVVDMHTSRNALDWPGTYEGLLPCADCPGIHTQLTLAQDDRFEIVARRLVRDATPTAGQGPFEWGPEGNVIALGAEGGEQRFAVGEGRLLLLDAGQTQPAWNRSEAILPQLPAAGSDARPELGEMLQDHRWMLVNATGANGQRLDALFPDPERSFAFEFAESRLHAQGGCNGFRGAFQIDDDGLLEVTGGMSTMMACPTPLMEADAALAALMAGTLEPVLVRGAQPTLVLLTQGSDALVLRGELTPEAQFGAPTRIFLEIAAQTVECEGSPRADGRCLQVRELTFDEQGLRVGEPSEWRTFTADIEGYEHEPGIRNVLRVNRFQPAAGPEVPAGPVYVLDLVVQSEVVAD
jgi:heat shock protein HslJ/uncharacterized lipoprotein NlpE involved in copper resistance